MSTVKTKLLYINNRTIVIDFVAFPVTKIDSCLQLLIFVTILTLQNINELCHVNLISPNVITCIHPKGIYRGIYPLMIG